MSQLEAKLRTFGTIIGTLYFEITNSVLGTYLLKALFSGFPRQKKSGRYSFLRKLFLEEKLI